MEEQYESAFCEVLEVIAHSEPSVKQKIPQTFINFLNKHKNPNYNPIIDFENPKWDETLSQEARVVIGLIYRDFIASEEEKKILAAEEAEEIKKEEEELRAKYNPDNIFKKEEPKVEVQTETVVENPPEDDVKGIDPREINGLTKVNTFMVKIKEITSGLVDKIKSMIKNRS